MNDTVSWFKTDKDELADLRKENKRLRDALAFYANKENWEQHAYRVVIGSDKLVHSAATVDQGAKAREALGVE